MVPSARLYNEHLQAAAVRPGPVGMSPNNVGSRCYYLLIREASMPQHAWWQSRPVFPSSTFRDMRAQRGYLRWGAGAVSASPRESKERTAGGSIHEKKSSSKHLGGGRHKPVGPAGGGGAGGVSASPRESKERTAGGSIHEKNSSSNHLGGGRNRPVGPAVGADPGRRPRARLQEPAGSGQATHLVALDQWQYHQGRDHQGSGVDEARRHRRHAVGRRRLGQRPDGREEDSVRQPRVAGCRPARGQRGGPVGAGDDDLQLRRLERDGRTVGQTRTGDEETGVE